MARSGYLLSMNKQENHSHRAKPVQLTFSEALTAETYLVGFRRTCDFKAGQVLGISLEEGGPRRLYSICSGEKEDEIKILYKKIDEGFLTPQLSDLEAGDTIWITPPGGEFTGDEEEAVWIATGTGIAPYYSMFRSGLEKNKTLIHGSRFLEDFHFFDEFSAALGTRYVRCCSGEESHEVYPGRVNAYLEELPELDPDVKYYLCGSAEMVVETRDLLIRKGVPYDRIISEIYF